MKKLVVNFIVSVAKLGAFIIDLVQDKEAENFYIVDIWVEILARGMRQEKEIKSLYIEKKKVKLFVWRSHDRICRKLKISYKNLELRNKFGSGAKNWLYLFTLIIVYPKGNQEKHLAIAPTIIKCK